MDLDELIRRLPYPIASIYAKLDDPKVNVAAKRESLYFTVYQLLRTLGLPLIGQYFTQDLPPDASKKNIQSFNESILRMRHPFFSDWIGLLNAAQKQRQALGLDFFPELADALNRAKSDILADIPIQYRDTLGKDRLPLLDAFLSLRNGCNHAGVSGDDECASALNIYRPALDRLLQTFGFLADYELLVLRAPLDPDAGTALIQAMCGPEPSPPRQAVLNEALEDAFADSPVVLRSPEGRCQALFPFFHGHIEGEPLRYYDGHYLSDSPYRRTIYYVGNGIRVPLDDATAAARLTAPFSSLAAERLGAMLKKRDIPWQMRREEVAPWTLLHTAQDFSRRTLDDQLGVKYLPSCYYDRPLWSEPLSKFVTTPTTPYRAFLLTGSAGCGKTALLCDLTDRLLRQEPEHAVFFLRGDGIVSEGDWPNGNLLLGNLLHKTGVHPPDFPTFGSFFGLLAEQVPKDQKDGRRFVIVIDALNEAGQAEKVLGEALEMVAAARPYPWLRIVLTARSEFFDVWRGRLEGSEGNPFYSIVPLFEPPPDDPVRPRRPDDLPAWRLPDFTPDEAELVYGRYQAAQARGEAVRACRTPWARLRPETQRNILTVPLHIDLWMSAFDRQDAPQITDSSDLFAAYLDDLRRRFLGFWENMSLIVDMMLARGRMELTDNDAHDLRAAWEAGRTDAQKRAYSPVELACLAGVMQKRVREEGGGYRIPFQRLREVLITRRLRDRSPRLDVAHLREWLALPRTDELEGALAQIADELWTTGRSADAALFLAPDEEANIAMGCNAFSRMLAHRLEVHEDAPLASERLSLFLDALQGNAASELRASTLLLFDVPSLVQGLSLTAEMIAFLKAVKDWMERQSNHIQEVVDWTRNLSVSYNKLGDAYTAAGDSVQALDYYKNGLEIRSRLYQQDPANAQFARDLSISYDRLGDAYTAAGDSVQALDYYREDLKIAQRLYRQDPANAQFARDLSISYDRLGDAYTAAGDSVQALDYYKNGLEIRSRLYQQDPANAQFARDLSISYDRLGDAYTAAGDSVQALDYYREDLKIAQRLYRQDPANAQFARDLSISYNKLGDAYTAAGDSVQALDYYKNGLEIRSRLYQQDPANAQFARDLSISYDRLGDAYTAAGDSVQALDYYKNGLEIRSRLYQQDPANAQFARDLSISYDKLGDAYTAAGDSVQALDYYREDLKIAQRLYRQDPANAGFAFDLCVSLVRVAEYQQAHDILQGLSQKGRLLHVQAQRLFEALRRHLDGQQ